MKPHNKYAGVKKGLARLSKNNYNMHAVASTSVRGGKGNLSAPSAPLAHEFLADRAYGNVKVLLISAPQITGAKSSDVS